MQLKYSTTSLLSSAQNIFVLRSDLLEILTFPKCIYPCIKHQENNCWYESRLNTIFRATFSLFVFVKVILIMFCLKINNFGGDSYHTGHFKSAAPQKSIPCSLRRLLRYVADYPLSLPR